jgi:uncharacterized membrane protein
VFTTLPTPPPTPPWEGMHPLVVHFPIALLLFAAVFVVLAIIVPKRGWWFSVSALILLIGGTAGAYVAVSTGEAARDVVEDGEDEMFEVMQEHEDQMDQAFKVFVALTIVYAGIVFLPVVARSLQSWKFVMPANLVFLAALLGANLLLASGAHLGGRLVHEFGVRAALAPEGEAAATEDEAEATEAEAESEEPAADADAEAPAAEAAADEAGVMEEETESAPDAEKEAPAEEPKAETPAAEAEKEAPAEEPKAEVPAPESANDGSAAEDAKEP